ncbi:MAG: hypothetical protein LBG82_07225 [Clostridiales Family XIII bacterium]|jgi:hypothetical protein|nr:hypothetical protein [Clostridiales Family XIII bacterium]
MKIIIIVAVAAAIFAVSAPAVFAAGDLAAAASDAGDSGSLRLIASSPQKGSTDLQSQNVGIKLYFSGNVTSKSVRKVNEECFEFTYKSGSKTKKLPVKAYFGIKPSENNYILAIVDTAKLKGNMLANNKKYQLSISGDLMSSDGKRLGSDATLGFTTVDQSGSTKIYMLLMVAMIGAMIAMTIYENKRKEKAAAEVAAKGGKVNPYKLAKEKKISVKEAMDLIERDRKRRLKRLGIEGGKDEVSAAAEAEKPRDTKKVKAPRPISAAGSDYKTGRAAIAERRAKAALEKYNKQQAAKKKVSRSGNSSSKNRNKRRK